MDTLTFIAKIIKAIAWPLAIVVAVILLRKQIARLLPLLRRLKYGDVELEFDREIEALGQAANSQLPEAPSEGGFADIREGLLRQSMVSPQAAVIQAWRYLEEQLVAAAKRHNLDVADTAWAMPMLLGGIMLNAGIISDSQYTILHRVKQLRNEAAHPTGMEVGIDDAGRYVELAIRLAASLSETSPEET